MKYVCGFLFTGITTKSTVALITKARPRWQAGALNGVGGKINEGEAPLDAMRREFHEEAGVLVNDWRLFCVLHHMGSVVHFYTACVPDGALLHSGDTDEPVRWYSVDRVLFGCHRMVRNLLWLIPMALDRDKVVAEVIDPSDFTNAV